jgi:hypothetical protein
VCKSEDATDFVVESLLGAGSRRHAAGISLMFGGFPPMQGGVTEQPGRPLVALPDTSAIAEYLGELAAVLWRERELLESLLFSLVQQQLVLTSGGTRWIARVDAMVQAAARAVQEHELVRAIEVDALAAQHGLPADVPLRDLAALAPEPWGTVLADHREALSLLLAEIDTVTVENRALLVAGERATREALEQVGALASAPQSGRYVADGPLSALRGGSVLDEQA